MSNATKVYEDVATGMDNRYLIRLETVEQLCATSVELAAAWRLFRMTDSTALFKFGPPINNAGEPITEPPHVDNTVYGLLKNIFEDYVSIVDDSIICVTVNTPAGGLFIQNINTCKHKFVTADLPPDSATAVISFEMVISPQALEPLEWNV